MHPPVLLSSVFLPECPRQPCEAHGRAMSPGNIQPVFFRVSTWEKISLGVPCITTFPIHHINLVGMDHFFHIMGNEDNGYIFFLLSSETAFNTSLRPFGSSIAVGSSVQCSLDASPQHLRWQLFVSGLRKACSETDNGKRSFCLFQTVIHTLPDFVCRNPIFSGPKTYILFHNRTNDLVVRF